jgi:hypothetical protein
MGELFSSLGRKRFQKWRSKIKMGLPIQISAGGKPPLLDLEAEDKFASHYLPGANNDLSQLRANFLICATDSARRRQSISPDEEIIGVSDTTFYKYHAENKAKRVTPQTTTTARNREEK